MLIAFVKALSSQKFLLWFYFISHCMSVHVYHGEVFAFILDSHLAICLGKKLSFWLSANSCLITMPLVYVHHSFPLVYWAEGVRHFYRLVIIAFLSICFRLLKSFS